MAVNRRSRPGRRRRRHTCTTLSASIRLCQHLPPTVHRMRMSSRVLHVSSATTRSTLPQAPCQTKRGSSESANRHHRNSSSSYALHRAKTAIRSICKSSSWSHKLRLLRRRRSASLASRAAIRRPLFNDRVESSSDEGVRAQRGRASRQSQLPPTRLLLAVEVAEK